MTALKPIEGRRVTGVPSQRYPLNALCSFPECAETAVDAHHCFPRSMIGNDSWFVSIDLGPEGRMHPIPHVVGLCRAHHDQVEAHDAWIKLVDGIFVWHDRRYPPQGTGTLPVGVSIWSDGTPLDPQPCSGEKRKKPVKRFTGEARRQRRTISIKVPDDTEDGGALWDEALDSVKTRLIQEGLYSPDDKIPVYEALMAALNDWLATPETARPSNTQDDPLYIPADEL